MAGIYVHIPFCHSKCAYCDFYSMPYARAVEEYVQALTIEWRLRRHEVPGPFETIYIGGGTPSILAPKLLRHIIEALPTQRLHEFTLETNPEDVTPDNVKAWRDMGINRISMGVQSLDDECLKRCNIRASRTGSRFVAFDAGQAHRTTPTTLVCLCFVSRARYTLIRSCVRRQVEAGR